MMRFVWLLMVLAFLTFPVFAQESTGEANEAPEEIRDCIPASEVEQSDDEESGPSGEEDSQLPLCEEEIPEAEAEETPPDEEEVADEEDDLPIEDVDIEPEDEISEDYPVPLPSDI